MIAALLLMLLTGAQGAGAAPPAPSDADRADGRCVAALTALSDAVSGEEKAGVEASMMFFMGKIAGRSGKAAVTPAITVAAAAMGEGVDAAVADKCIDEIKATTDAM